MCSVTLLGSFVVVNKVEPSKAEFCGNKPVWERTRPILKRLLCVCGSKST